MINPNMDISVVYVGQEAHPLIIMDNFIVQPEAMIDVADNNAKFIAQPSDFYPGLRQLVSGEYPKQCLSKLTPLIQTTFSVPETNTATISLCAFSLATTPTHKLRPIQCVPHIDTQDPNQFALVHYLCAETYSGTSFYRHRKTGFESITPQRAKHYFDTLKHEAVAGGLVSAQYICGDTELFQRTEDIPLKYNRAIIYRSNTLHSGNIFPERGLSPNPRTGRLTINSFINFSL